MLIDTNTSAMAAIKIITYHLLYGWKLYIHRLCSAALVLLERGLSHVQVNVVLIVFQVCTYIVCVWNERVMLLHSSSKQ